MAKMYVNCRRRRKRRSKRSCRRKRRRRPKHIGIDVGGVDVCVVIGVSVRVGLDAGVDTS